MYNPNPKILTWALPSLLKRRWGTERCYTGLQVLIAVTASFCEIMLYSLVKFIRRNVSPKYFLPKHQLTFTRLHSIISQKAELFKRHYAQHHERYEGKKLARQVTLLNCTQDVSSSNPGQDWLSWGILWFSSVPPRKYWDNMSFSSASLPIHIIRSFNATQPELLSVSLT
jgi:hypothetical protein